MADGRHFENRFITISQRKITDFDEILYTAADFELDERHVIKNELDAGMWRYHANRMDARRSQFDLGRVDAYI